MVFGLAGAPVPEKGIGKVTEYWVSVVESGGPVLYQPLKKAGSYRVMKFAETRMNHRLCIPERRVCQPNARIVISQGRIGQECVVHEPSIPYPSAD